MLVAHADWSVSPRKRWLATGRVDGADGRIDVLDRVGDLSTLLDRLSGLAAGAPVLLGIDTPIGLPTHYAQRAGIGHFPEFLRESLGAEEWADFASPGHVPSDVSYRRPFYPARPGGTQQAHLLAGLGAETTRDLRRACERVPINGRLPGVLFWTLGGNQTGRGALALWTQLLAPALREDGIRLWPFDGELPDLLTPGTVTIAETYPTALAELINARVPLPGKRRQPARAEAGGAMLTWCGRHGVAVDQSVRQLLLTGFGPSKSGEDPFDAVAGLAGMLAILIGAETVNIPATEVAPEIRTVEGWILGIASPTLASPHPAQLHQHVPVGEHLPGSRASTSKRHRRTRVHPLRLLATNH